MARDGMMPQSRLRGLEPTPDEIRAATPEGQEINHLVDLYMNGDAEGFDKAVQDYVTKRGINLENNSYLKRLRKKQQ